MRSISIHLTEYHGNYPEIISEDSLNAKKKMWKILERIYGNISEDSF